MLRQAARVCALCEARSLLGTTAPRLLQTQTQTRLYTQVQTERGDRQRSDRTRTRPRSLSQSGPRVC